MRLPCLVAALAFILTASACTPAPDLPPVQPYAAAALAKLHYKAVFVAGDDSLPLFDNAADGVETRLRERGAIASGARRRLSADLPVP